MKFSDQWQFEGAVILLSWKEGAVNLKMAKPGAVRGQKGGAVVSKLVPQLKESVPPPPPPPPPRAAPTRQNLCHISWIPFDDKLMSMGYDPLYCASWGMRYTSCARPNNWWCASWKWWDIVMTSCGSRAARKWIVLQQWTTSHMLQKPIVPDLNAFKFMFHIGLFSLP